jgi:hypothetical protein
MGAPAPELCNLWLARAFNAHDLDVVAAMYHPEASVVQIDDVHGGQCVTPGAAAMAAYEAAYGRRHPPHDRPGRFRHDPLTVAEHGYRQGRQSDQDHRKLWDGTWVFFIDHPEGAVFVGPSMDLEGGRKWMNA